MNKISGKFVSKTKLIESLLKQFPQINYDDANAVAKDQYNISFTKQHFWNVKNKLKLPQNYEELNKECYKHLCKLVNECGLFLIDELLMIIRSYGVTLLIEQLKYIEKLQKND